jgi:hypothetical protein
MDAKKFKKIMNTDALQKAEERLRYWCHKYIILRDLIVMDNMTFGICIACGKTIRVEFFSDRSMMNGKKFHASHLFDSQKYAATRFDERNLNLSCDYCNRHLHGNKENYQVNLLKKIEREEFESLVQLHYQMKKWTILEIESLKNYYKEKAKALAKEKNININ